ncbi:hypothetical protein AVEN_106475-1 [Araneus ventricosus]|uniref:Uncharacterized protein n=1 Tax=Araneus ventricosus TaxID=182803 RepID=A0A4Y2ATB9_ARAVE|nr:hypothetical protein AVEN_106475-1 [Araneus ventricosus]
MTLGELILQFDVEHSEAVHDPEDGPVRPEGGQAHHPAPTPIGGREGPVPRGLQLQRVLGRPQQLVWPRGTALRTGLSHSDEQTTRCNPYEVGTGIGGGGGEIFSSLCLRTKGIDLRLPVCQQEVRHRKRELRVRKILRQEPKKNAQAYQFIKM